MNIELIDTQWNVNVNVFFVKKMPRYELIDTQWNVNNLRKKIPCTQKNGINRYIVECKFKIFNSVNIDMRELIDTQWNVNSVTGIGFRFIGRINRYIVECKCGGTSGQILRWSEN